MQRINNLYAQCFGTEPTSVTAIAGEGSSRKYYLLDGVKRCVATIGLQRRENEAFIYLSEYFRHRGLPVPEVYAVSDDMMVYLQEDVGDKSVYDELCAYNGDAALIESLLTKIMRILPRFHYCVGEDFDSSKCYPLPAMDRQAVMWDLNYFKYCFLKPVGIEFDEPALEKDFIYLADQLSDNPDSTLLLRDFQSRNVMLDSENNPSVIDFQGARLGDGLYDIASFVWQARANYSSDIKQRLVESYRNAVVELTGSEPKDFQRRLDMMVFFRTLQVLGAYGFRGYVQGKAKFVASIPGAIVNLREVLSDLPTDFCPYLVGVLKEMVSLPSLQPVVDGDGLTVTVMSFSYKKGLPTDNSGNGGGFVFDCRGMHNPGRYEQYKPLTGRDRAVIDFLEERGEIQQFLSSCYSLVDASVECYLRRGFSSLMVCFGCTGGRHRSVYSAEHMADHLAQKFGVKVHLIHREQDIDEIR